LSSNNLAIIQDQTNLDPDAIREAHKRFIKEYPEGKVPCNALEAQFEGKDKEVCEIMIKIMDADGNGWVDFKEMIVFTSMMESIASNVEPDEKSLRWLFRTFDLDNSGSICQKEFLKVAEFISMVKKEKDKSDWELHNRCGVLGTILHSITELITGLSAKLLFTNMDTNNDNVLDEEEFISGMKEFFKTNINYE